MEMPVRLALTAALALVPAMLTVGCTRPEGYDGGGFARASGSTEYRVEDRADGGFLMTVRFAQYQFVPETAAVEERCRREAVALAHDEMERRGLRNARVEDQRVRSSAGRNGFGGITSCTASVPVVVSAARS